MKFFFFLLMFVSVRALSQNSLLADTLMQKALSDKGLKNTNYKFKPFIATTTKGITYTEDSLNNKITFINFWFEGCLPCIAEFDALNKLYDKYKSDKRFQFLSFTYETRENALRVAKKYLLDYPIITVDPKEIYSLIFNLGFPTSMLINTEGKIVLIKCGGFNDEKNASKMVDSLYSAEIEKLLLLL